MVSSSLKEKAYGMAFKTENKVGLDYLRHNEKLRKSKLDLESRIKEAKWVNRALCGSYWRQKSWPKEASAGEPHLSPGWLQKHPQALMPPWLAILTEEVIAWRFHKQQKSKALKRWRNSLLIKRSINKEKKNTTREPKTRSSNPNISILCLSGSNSPH